MIDFVGKASEKIQKLSKEQIERIISMINEENEVFDSILESLDSGIIVLDNRFLIQKINRAVKRFVPVSSSLFEEENPVWDCLLDEDISQFIRKNLEKNISHVEEEFSVYINGKTLFVGVSIVPLCRKGDICGSIIIFRDMTAKRQQQILTHRMESLSSLTNLAASVAHEIKNPLGAISIHVQLLQKAVKKSREGDGILPDEKFMERYLDVVNEEIERLNSTVMDFLFAVRPVKAELVLCDPDKTIGKALELFAPEFNERGIRLILKLAENGTKILLDEKLFRDVLVNLVQNAKAALGKTEKDEMTIAVTSLVRNDRYILTVADTGCGMDKETMDRVFEPYYTTKADGTGLGLTTVYKIVKEFNGEITVSSELGRGSIFTISLPVPQKETMLLEQVK